MQRAKLCISRVGSSDEVTSLILVEGGAFTIADITGALSKESRGSIVSKLEQVPPTGPQRVGILGFVVAVPLLLYVFINGLPYLASYISLDTHSGTIDLQGWSVPDFYKSVSRSLLADFEKQEITVVLGAPVRKKAIVKIPFTVTNRTDERLNYTIKMTTAASEDAIESYKRTHADVLVVPGASSQKAIDVAVPEGETGDPIRTVYVDFYIESPRGSLSMSRTLVVQ